MIKFEYEKIMKLAGFNEGQINYFKKNTGYGKLYSNFKLSEQYQNIFLDYDIVIPINQCNYMLLDREENNSFVIFQSDYLPLSFIKTIKKQTGKILVNSKWMKDVVLQQTNCNQDRIFTLPYLENFDLLNKYNRLKKTTSADTLRFYTIGDSKNVKNLQNLVKAFQITFGQRNDVLLTIKTSNSNLNSNNKNIKIINQIIPEVQLYELHINNDVYISTAMSVGWQIPPFQASFFKKPLICGKHSAFTQWVDYDKVIILESHKKQIILKQYMNRFKSKKGNLWNVNVIQVDEIVNKLKYVYDNYDRIKNNYTDVSRFDVKNVNYFL